MTDRKVAREFKDPDMPSSHRGTARAVILFLISAAFVVTLAIILAQMITPSEIQQPYTNITTKNPDYIKVKYEDEKFHVSYNNTNVNSTNIEISIIGSSYTFPVLTYTSMHSNNFDEYIVDRNWGYEYLLSVCENYDTYSVKYHWIITKSQIGFNTVRSL
jgi:hypothetical protein